MKVVVNSQQNKVASVNTQGTTSVVSIGIQGPSGVNGQPGAIGPAGPIGPSSGVSSAIDVDVANLQNDSLLVYKTNTNKWTATKELSAQNMDAGEY